MKHPTSFGKYLLLDRINVGGMAEVFMAKAFGVEGFERLLAIKRILPSMAEDDEFINMFVDEARIAVQLSHANVVQIYELGKFDNQYYIAMEYVSGKDLRQILDNFRRQNKTLPLPMAAYITSKICDGLDYAHRKSDPVGNDLHLIHRDVSPQNILVSYDGAVKITDFGIAKAENRASKTQAGVLKGKFGYMSPEQVRGLPIDHRSDIFAVGILLYEMVTGQRLFIGESDFSTLEKVRNAEVTPPTELNPEIPEELERMMQKALAKDRDERYQWPAELHDDLQQFLIADNTIYNAKPFSMVLREMYQEEIELERKKMGKFATVQPPDSLGVNAAASEMQAGSRFPAAEHAAEKTMIFESGFDGGLSSAATPIGSSQASFGAVDGTDANVSEAARAPARAPSHGGVRRHPQTPPHRANIDSQRQKQLAAGIITGAVLLSVLIILWALWPSATAVGTIIVTSTPTDKVHIYLDEELIGTKTPLVNNEVELGKHILRATAKGFGEKQYRFTLIAGPPASIAVALAPLKVGPEVLEVLSVPAGAAVHIGGQQKGQTPLTLTGLDAKQPAVFQVSRKGYEPQTVTVRAEPGKSKQSVTVKLKVLPRSRLEVDSDPSGAVVFLDRMRRGVTPLEIADLGGAATHQLELVKDGYEKHGRSVRLDGQAVTTVKATLTPERPRPQPPKPKKTCSGSAATISVATPGEANCRVVIGRTELGIAPMFNKRAPSGRCTVSISCASGKSYRSTRTIKAGSAEKVIVKGSMWQ